MSKSYKLVLRIQNPLRDTTTLSVGSGTYNITSNGILLTEVDVLSIEQGSYSISGQNITFATTDTFDATFDSTFG